ETPHSEKFGSPQSQMSNVPPSAQSTIMPEVAVSAEVPEADILPEDADTETPLPIEEPVVASTARFSVLTSPLPRWVWLSVLALTVLLLTVLQVRGEDWAAGAMQAGIAASIITVIAVLILGMR